MAKIDKKDINGKTLIFWLIVTLSLIFATVLFIFIDVYQQKTEKITKQKHDLITDNIRASIKYYDESMSMSARLFTFTGDNKWQERYKSHEIELKVALDKVDAQAEYFFNNDLFEATKQAANNIKNVEENAFNQKKSTTKPVDKSPLLDASYNKNKQDLALRINYLSMGLNNTIRLNQLQSQIAYIDEVLTMSARMASYTGDTYWKDRYDRMVTILDASITEALRRSNNIDLSLHLSAVSAANDQLIGLESQAFEFVANNRLPDAINILFGNEYQTQKDIYAQGINQFSLAINQEVEKSVASAEQYIKIETVIIIVILSIFTFLILYITKQIKNWEVTLDTRNKELEKKKNELEIFSYSMSHDLKAPLKSIQGFSKRIAKHIDKGNFESLNKLNSHILLNAIKLDDLVDNIMEVVKAEKINDLVEEVDFDALAITITNEVDALENQHNVQFTADFNHHTGIYCHQHSLYQILMNLVNNAIKYAKPDIDNAFFKLETSMQTTDILKIEVSDNGIGIGKNMHDRVFTMFFRESSSHSFGTGLGLYLVKKQVENMNGTISFSSDTHGTLFVILLPTKPMIGQNK